MRGSLLTTSPRAAHKEITQIRCSFMIACWARTDRVRTAIGRVWLQGRVAAAPHAEARLRTRH